ETPRWVVNAAGGYRGGPVADTDPETLRFLLDVNLGTVFWSCRAAARRRDREHRRARGGRRRGGRGRLRGVEGRRRPPDRGARERARRAWHPCECGAAAPDRHPREPRGTAAR